MARAGVAGERAGSSTSMAGGDPAGLMRTVRLPSGRAAPALGLGTWEMGESRATWREELGALRLGLDLGMTLIDTAEMYGDGRAERLVGEAIEGRRTETFLVSKVLPQHATRRGTLEACTRSLERLKSDYLDLYLLHWLEDVPLEETLSAFEALRASGAILDYGVSNFDESDLERAVALPGGDRIAANQVLYNLKHRGIEWDVLPWCRARGLPIMAYSPLGRGDLIGHGALQPVAERHHATPAQIALAWTLQHQDVIAIPKASNPAHVRANRAALDITLTSEDFRTLDHAFPPPREKIPLEVG